MEGWLGCMGGRVVRMYGCMGGWVVRMYRGKGGLPLNGFHRQWLQYIWRGLSQCTSCGLYSDILWRE